MSPRSNRRPRGLLALASTTLALAPLARAGGGPEDVLLIVDPSIPESLRVANVYLSKRDIPRGNVLYMEPGAANYAQFAARNVKAFLGSLEQRGLAHVDYVVVPPGGNFYVPASGYIADSCVPVNRFTIVAGYTLAHQADAILAGMNSTARNHYSKDNFGARAFDSETAWWLGNESTEAFAERYYIGAMLGYTGSNGNTLQEVLDLIDRSVAADFTQPVGTVYYMETTDQARSGPRHDFFPSAVFALNGAGGQGQHLLGVLPGGSQDCMGVMTGWATPDIDGENMTLLPGSFADHLTSFAGTFTTTSQTKMSRWIAKGASGTAGTVEEPCNYAAKFPAPRLHVLYRKGLSLGEAWFRSAHAKPFQPLLYGDPLTRPYAEPPTVDLPGLPGTPVSGIVALTPTATATAQGATIEALHLFVEGQRNETIAAGGSFALDTTQLADGVNELRVVADDSTLWRNQATHVAQLLVDNHGHSLSLAASATTGDLATAFDFTVAAASGGASPLERVQLVQNGRVIGSTDQASGTIRVYGQNLGAGPVRVHALALFADGTRARSTSLDLDVDPTGALPLGLVPTAFDYRVRVHVGAPALLELPSAHGEDFATLTHVLTAVPAQADLLSSAGPAYVLLEPHATADGTDTLAFRVDGAPGSSNVATITIEYVRECPLPVSECSTAPNSVGAGMTLDHAGSPSVSANDLELVASGGPSGQPGIYYYGPNSIQQPFGDGWRCVGGSSFRLPALAIDGAGEAHLALDVTSPPSPAGQISAGESWVFQFWYRDPAAGGSGYNLSDALRVTFCP